MKIKRFVAAGIRQAMQRVRDEQGPEAVILSTRRLDDGIEVIAAIDYDEALVREAAAQAMPAPAATTETRAPEPRPPETRPPEVGPAAVRSEPTGAFPQPAPTEPRTGTLGPTLGGMREELGNLREMLESQLASLAWNDLGRRNPLHASVLRQLTRMDIDADIARSVTDELPADLSPAQARYLPLGLLARRVGAGARQLSSLQGILALIGPTGAGKTTTVAKLAAHAVLHHGADQVALVSTDHYRIGAGAQLGHYARVLGIPVHEVHAAGELRKLLARLGDKRTVLVDTAGMGAHDARLADQLHVLKAALPQLCPILVLAANVHAQAMDAAVRAWLPLAPRASILTKLDEAPRLGGALSVLVRHGIGLDFTCAGQRVPEDIAAADARQLVCRASSHATVEPEGEDIVLAERFGRPAPATA